ncbi:MAG: cation transporting ATPase C-terminal domain-containing protein, partial [Actinomycetes bacterium]
VFTRAALVLLVTMTGVLASAGLLAAAVAGGADDTRRTTLFAALGAGQLGIALALRSARSGPGLRGRGLEVAVLGAALLLAAAVWLPPLQALVHTRPLPLDATLVAVLAAAVPGTLLRLWLRGSTGRRSGRTTREPPDGRRPYARGDLSRHHPARDGGQGYQGR